MSEGASHYKNGEKVAIEPLYLREYAALISLSLLQLQIVMYVNKVGPYFNPQETYHYYSLPICRPKRVSGVVDTIRLVNVLTFSPFF